MRKLKNKLFLLKFYLSNLFRFQWRPFPKIFVHEKLEKPVKWLNRIIAFGGAFVCFLALPTIWDFTVGFVLLSIGIALEKVIFEYTVIITQPPPEFQVDPSQWITNGYLFPNPSLEEAKGLPCYFGPTFRDKEYADQFYEYIKGWNQDELIDKDNNIYISFIKEVDHSYSTFLYANPQRKWIDDAFHIYKKLNKLEKYGKEQQNMVMQMVYWKTLPIKAGTLFYGFLDSVKINPEFFFTCFYLQDERVMKIEAEGIKKCDYKYKERESIEETDLEYRFDPTTSKEADYEYVEAVTSQDAFNKVQMYNLTKLLSKGRAIEFTLGTNENAPPVISVDFQERKIAFEAYSKLRAFVDDDELHVLVSKMDDSKLSFIVNSKVSLTLNFDESELDTFIKNNQSKGKVVIAFGFKHQDQFVIVPDNDPFRPILIDRFNLQVN